MSNLRAFQLFRTETQPVQTLDVAQAGEWQGEDHYARYAAECLPASKLMTICVFLELRQRSPDFTILPERLELRQRVDQLTRRFVALAENLKTSLRSVPMKLTRLRLDRSQFPSRTPDIGQFE